MMKIRKVITITLLVWQIIGIVLLTHGIITFNILTVKLGVILIIMGCALSVTYAHNITSDN